MDQLGVDQVGIDKFAIEQIRDAVFAGDGETLTQLMESHPGLKSHVNDPLFPFDQTALVFAAGRGSRRVVEALLNAGADINARSQWWAGGFGVLDSADPELAGYLIDRGAIVDAHSAARLGMFDKLKLLVSANPELVHARGGDGQTPLHFASTAEIAEFLLDRGADIEARDIDHESTACAIPDSVAPGCGALPDPARREDRHPDGCRARRHRPGSQTSRRRPGMHSDVRQRAVFPKTKS